MFLAFSMISLNRSQIFFFFSIRENLKNKKFIESIIKEAYDRRSKDQIIRNIQDLVLKKKKKLPAVYFIVVGKILNTSQLFFLRIVMV